MLPEAPVGVAVLGGAMTPANGAPDARIASARNAIPLRPSWLHGSATRPSTCTGWPTVTFGSPATVTAMTSPPEASSAISCTCHNGKPVSRSIFGLAGIERQPLLRCPGAHKRHPRRIDPQFHRCHLPVCKCVGSDRDSAVTPRHRNSGMVRKGRPVMRGSSRDVTSPARREPSPQVRPGFQPSRIRGAGSSVGHNASRGRA